MAFEQGGGGGKAPGFTQNTVHALSKPYELSGEMTPGKMAQLDEMLQRLFDSVRFTATDVQTLTVTVEENGSGSGGDVVGPSSATDSNVAVFSGTTGKLLQDGGSTLADLASPLKFVTRSITNAEIAAGNTSPITLVAAVSSKVIVPVTIILVVTTTVVYTSSPVWSLRHSMVAGNLTNTVAPNLQALVTTQHLMGSVDTHTYSDDPTNKGLVLFLNADPTGTGTATAKVHLAYYLQDSISSV